MHHPTSPPTEPPEATAAVHTPNAEPTPGALLGGYRVVRLIGRGGMGVVYEGWDERLARRVALKRIPVAQEAQAETRARFWREARTLAALRHPGIVTIYEIGEDPRDHSLFIAMELVVGTSLASLAARAPTRPVASGEVYTGRPAALPARLVVHLGREVALALGAAHEAKVTHRDVKPANILIEDSGHVRVIDFGLARHIDDLDHRLTRSGATLGTPGFMAPEAVDGKEVGPAADVFAVGILLYRLASGVHPFERDTAQATALAIAGARFLPLAKVAPRVPPALAAVVERCLSLDPTARPADGRALAAELGAVAAALGVDPERERQALAAWVAGPWDEPLAPIDTQPSVSAPPSASRRKTVGAVALALAAGAIVWGATGGFSSGSSSSSPINPGSLDPGSIGARPASLDPSPNAVARPASLDAGPNVAARPGSLDDGAVRPLPLPPRPAIAILGIAPAADQPGSASRADVLADLLRVRLDEAPDAVLSVPQDLLAATLPEAPLTRPGRAPGHIDVAIRGRLDEAPDRVTVTLDLVDTTSARPLAQLTRSAPDLMTLGDLTATALFELLGADPPTRKARLTRVPEAWSAWIAARLAQRQANLGTVEDNLRWALRLDPGFGLARAEALPMLHALARTDELAQRAAALLADDAGPAGPILPEHTRLQVEALALVAADRRADAIPKLHAILDRYPFDVEAADLLMMIRADGPTRDYQEVEKVARRQLALAPRLETPASRLIRVLGTRNRATEADALFQSLGLSRSDPALTDLFAELDLFAGRFGDASRAFTKVFAAEPGNLYAEHMAIAAELLGGRCDKAAGLALDRIERHRLLGKDALLGWTYSLAVQALVCWEQWDGLEAVLARWSEHDEDGRVQAFGMRERALFSRARILPPADRPRRMAELETRWARMLDEEGSADPVPPRTRSQIENLLLQVTRDRPRLERLLATAERAAADLSVPAIQRAEARHVVARLRGRLSLIAPSPDPAATLAHYQDATLDWGEVHGEADTSALVEGLAQRADAATQLAAIAPSQGPREREYEALAASDWRTIAALGYPRLWVTDLWVVARHRLGQSPEAAR